MIKRVLLKLDVSLKFERLNVQETKNLFKENF